MSNNKANNEVKDSSKEVGVVSHVFRKIVVLDHPGTMVKNLGFNPVILSCNATSIEVDGKQERAYEIMALIPVIKVQGIYKDLSFEETIQREFGHPLLPRTEPESKS